MVVYTKKGDKGKTSNVLGKVYSKSYILIELQGGIDEINANIGVLRCKLGGNVPNVQELKRIDAFLKKVQYNLFLLGTEVSMEFTKNMVKPAETQSLEQEIDYMTERMQPLKNFIYQSGNEASVLSHVVRSVTRRVERVFVRISEEQNCPESYQYINRLSDYFFTLARYLNHINGKEEEVLIIKES